MGSKKQTILVLNGRRYNALTGELVASNSQDAAVHTISDIVSNRPKDANLLVGLGSTTPESLLPISSHKVMDISRSSATAKRRQPQRSNTLVRSGVSKPKPGIKSQTKVLAPTTAVAVPLNTIKPKWPVTQVSPSRLRRSERVTKSEAITKFSSFEPVYKPSAPRVTPLQTSVGIAIAAVAQESQKSQTLFERAIAAADSHNQPPVDPKKLARQARKQAKGATKAANQLPMHRHVIGVMAASIAVLALCGVLGMQNRTAITLRFANAKAGFQASLPDYQPDGYGVGSFTYSAGTVGTSFHNTTNGRNYSLNQQTTKWDARALLDNYVAPNYPSYQVLQSNQQTVYLYGKNDASWIKHGVWYLLTTDGSLSTSQVLNIASSV